MMRHARMRASPSGCHTRRPTGHLWASSPPTNRGHSQARSSSRPRSPSETTRSSPRRWGMGDAPRRCHDEAPMSSVFVPFLFQLRACKVKVGTQEAMALAGALTQGLHESSLDGFYHGARALAVLRAQELDAFDQAFLAHFRGVRLAGLDLVKEREDWL